MSNYFGLVVLLCASLHAAGAANAEPLDRRAGDLAREIQADIAQSPDGLTLGRKLSTRLGIEAESPSSHIACIALIGLAFATDPESLLLLEKSAMASQNSHRQGVARAALEWRRSSAPKATRRSERLAARITASSNEVEKLFLVALLGRLPAAETSDAVMRIIEHEAPGPLMFEAVIVAERHRQPELRGRVLQRLVATRKKGIWVPNMPEDLGAMLCFARASPADAKTECLEHRPMSELERHFRVE